MKTFKQNVGIEVSADLDQSAIDFIINRIKEAAKQAGYLDRSRGGSPRKLFFNANIDYDMAYGALREGEFWHCDNLGGESNVEYFTIDESYSIGMIDAVIKVITKHNDPLEDLYEYMKDRMSSCPYDYSVTKEGKPEFDSDKVLIRVNMKHSMDKEQIIGIFEKLEAIGCTHTKKIGGSIYGKVYVK